MKTNRIYISIAVLAIVTIGGLQLSSRDAAEEKPLPAVEPAALLSPPVDLADSTDAFLASPEQTAEATSVSVPDLPAVVSDNLVAAETRFDDASDTDAQETLEDLKREMFDEEASVVLPLLSVQTFRNENDPSDAASAEASQRQLIDGPFGRIAPPDGHIWIRIDATYAQEHKDIMAQTADLYRAETGYEQPVTVMLWVGGRPYKKQVYAGS